MPAAPAPTLRSGLPHRLRRFVFRKRRVLAALLFCAAAGIAVEAALPREEHLVRVIVAGSDLPVGTVLSMDQLSFVDLPPDAVPSRAFTDLGALVGEHLSTPVHQGDILADTFLVGAGLLAGTPAGTVAVPLRPADPSTVALISPGQRVDVVLSTGNGFEVEATSSVLAQGLAVLWTSTSSTAPGWPAPDEADGLVVVAAEPSDAAALAGASSSGQVHLVLTSAPR